jgi:type 1 glutamine amidotransferase
MNGADRPVAPIGARGAQVMFRAGGLIMRSLPMWKRLPAIALVVVWATVGAFRWAPAHAEDHPARVLYFTHSAGYRHDVIPASREILKQIGEREPRFEVTASEDVSVFTAENLRGFGAVMFFTTGELPMSDLQKKAFMDFVSGGGGFLGVHSATDTFYEWPEYGRLIGGYFDQHPWHHSVRIDNAEPFSLLTARVGRSLTLTDEIYQIRDFDAAGSRVLLRLDPASVDLGRENVHRHPYGWPLAWTRAYGRGRVFYSALGHEEGVWRDARFQILLHNAVLWAIGRVTP